MQKVYILYSCDEQKWADSMKVIAATTDREALLELIANKVRTAEMHYGGKTAYPGYDELEKDIKSKSVDFRRLDYGFVQETENIQTADKKKQLSKEDIEAAVKQEFIRRLKANGYEYETADENDNDRICKGSREVIVFDDERNMLYKPEHRDEAYELSRLKNEVREYVTAYMTAKANGAEHNQSYYILADWNRHVLSASKSQFDSYMFVTWEKGYDGKGYNYGHYSEDYTKSKEDFAKRAGLINENKLFTETELKVIRSNLSDFISLDSGTYLDRDKERAIESVISKIDDLIVPEIKENQEEHEAEGEEYEHEL